MLNFNLQCNWKTFYKINFFYGQLGLVGAVHKTVEMENNKREHENVMDVLERLTKCVIIIAKDKIHAIVSNFNVSYKSHATVSDSQIFSFNTFFMLFCTQHLLIKYEYVKCLYFLFLTCIHSQCICFALICTWSVITVIASAITVLV